MLLKMKFVLFRIAYLFIFTALLKSQYKEFIEYCIEISSDIILYF
ncbi:hypothetical protein F4694_000914 [Bacillus niacini]|uniref:Uncharacterized protein n=1 Tax=Neobacillus niacini TaxID=86668 RepID=A0A852T601_9BACI|nr:hypothetical protein [Neobacillus niacini]